MRIGWLILGLVPLVTAASCVLGDFAVRDDVVNGSGGGGQSAAGGAGGEGVGGCNPVKLPGAPGTSDPGPNDVSFVAAMRQLEFGDDVVSDVKGSDIGFDLDETCGCFVDNPSCSVPADAGVAGCDGVNGVDNGFAGVVSAFSQFSVSGDTFAESVTKGLWTALVRVDDYNGQANDATVKVAIYTGRRFVDDACNDGEPAWDGNDRWPIDAESLIDSGLGGAGGMAGAGGMLGSGGAGGDDACSGPGAPALDAPRYTSVTGYVTDGILVATFDTVRFVPSAIITANTEVSFDIRLSDATITANVSEGAQGWELSNGIASGKWKLVDAFSALSQAVKIGQAFCTNNQLYSLVKGAICNQRDLTTTFGDECDAVSFGAAFDATPAVLGTVLGPEVPVVCPAMFDPAEDNCNKPTEP